jgi:hypothetical protein
MNAPHSALVRIAALALLCGGASPIAADVLLRDPGIPDGESAVYAVRTGDKKTTFTERTSVTGGGENYLILYLSDTETIETSLRKRSMVPLRVRRVVKGPEQTLETITSVSRLSDSNIDKIPVLAFSDLKYSLRGFPFGVKSSLPVGFMNGSGQEGGAQFSIQVKYLGIEEKVVAGRRISTHKLEIQTQVGGVLRVLSAMVPRTYYWYSVTLPHYLVAFEGSSGFPGSPKNYIEITDYSGWH